MWNLIAGAAFQKKAYNIRSRGEKDRKEQARLGNIDAEARRQRMWDDILKTAGGYDAGVRQQSIDKNIAGQQAGMTGDLSGATLADTDANESADTLAYRSRRAEGEGQRMSDIVRSLARIQGPGLTVREQNIGMADLTSRLAQQIADARAMSRAYQQAQADTMRRANRRAGVRDQIGGGLMSMGMSGGGGGGGDQGGWNTADYNAWADRNQ